MAKITIRKINEKSWVNDTWLTPYCGYYVKLVEYKNGRMDMHLDQQIYKYVNGEFTAPNGWNYTTKKLMGGALSDKNLTNPKKVIK